MSDEGRATWTTPRIVVLGATTQAEKFQHQTEAGGEFVLGPVS